MKLRMVLSVDDKSFTIVEHSIDESKFHNQNETALVNKRIMIIWEFFQICRKTIDTLTANDVINARKLS